MFFSVSTFFCFLFYFFKIEIALSIPFQKLRKAAIKRYSDKYIVFNLINFIKLCSLLATFVNTQETFQRGLSVVIMDIWRREVGQCQIIVETTLCMSTLKFTTLNNVQSTLSISALILTRLDNVKTMMLFSTSSFITLINFEATLRKWFSKSWKERKNIILRFKKMMTLLINNTCFWLRSIKKKGKHGTYNVTKKIVRKYNAWCMKRIRKY